MSHGFPPGLTYQSPLFSGPPTVHGVYRGVNVFADRSRNSSTWDLWDVVNLLDPEVLSWGSRHEHESTMRVAVELTGPLPYLTIANREGTNDSIAVGSDGQPPHPFDKWNVDFAHSLSIGYPPFDDRYVVSSGDIGFLRTVMRPELAQWMVSVHDRVRWQKVVFLESRVWALSSDKQLDPGHVLPLADYLIEMLHHTHPVATPAPAPGAQAFGGDTA
ncbi:hypothetical protein [Gandjariella thermophila]|uniref:Uncharacterized protein n=1 Tax=Gandjariella thermophila TaxID=1931992 RepID=A0A4D4J404_9PSEU|nr:hypothetical protein [Gandjariella thermophila]GDY29359.1 hypothetical protein GTS_09920 [Gandjariella thermophila]